MFRLILLSLLISQFQCEINFKSPGLSVLIQRQRRPAASSDTNTESNLINFYLFRPENNTAEISTFDRDLASHGCDTEKGNFSIIVHGWKESIHSGWVFDMLTNLTHFRGGCILFMDYSGYSIVSNYFRLTPYFRVIANALQRKVMQINSHDRLFMFGFSFGARLCIEVGSKIEPKIDRIDVCDPAGPGFDNLLVAHPQSAARNVQCINTSIDKGTSIYNCHQNFRMGRCGHTQPGSTVYPMKHHGLCPHFYNSAFHNDFIPTNDLQCSSRRRPEVIPKGLKMGFLGVSSQPAAYGDFFVPTSEYPPWNVLNYTNFVNF